MLIVLVLILPACDKKDPDNGIPSGNVQLIRSRVGTVYLDLMRLSLRYLWIRTL